MSNHLRLALDSLLRQRERPALTILGVALAITCIVGVVFTTLSIYFVFAIPWTKDISPEQWIIYMGGLMAAFVISGLVVWVIGLRRAKSVSVEADLAQYAVEE